MRAHELARELNISQKELVNFLQQRRLTRNPSAPLSPAAIEAARHALSSTAVATKIAPTGDKKIQLPPNVSVKDLSDQLAVGAVEVIKKLMQNGLMATINQVTDFDTASIVADEFGVTVAPNAAGDSVAIAQQGGAGDGQATDVVGLVVAADDGVMPQTIEAIQHAKAAKVPIIVAINKIDKDNANIDRVHAELAEQGIVTTHYGGDYECVHVSARTGVGLDDLTTTLVLTTELEDRKANPDRNAIGTIAQPHIERG